MNKQELIEEIKNLENHNASKRTWVNRGAVLELVEELDEPQKVTVPQIVADYIEYAKENDWDLQDAMDPDIIANERNGKFSGWFYKDKNMEALARAWLDDYTVEKEKRYRVKMKNAYYNKHPQFLCETDNGIFWAVEIDLRKTKFTRKELENAGFGEVFNSPLFEVEELD